MILIEWYQTDWFYYLPIILVILFAAILILRIIRRWTRWRLVDVSHVAILPEKLDPSGLLLYIRKDSPEDTDDMLFQKIVNPTFPCVFLILPLGVNQKKRNNLASSLAMAGWNVIVLPKATLIDWINQKQFDTKLQDLLDKFPIKAGIIFDFACSVIFSSLNRIQKPIQWIFIRPTWSWKHIQSCWTSIPFSILWGAKLSFQSFRKQIKDQNIIEIVNLTEKITPESLQKDVSDKIFLIHAGSTWIDKEGSDCMNRWHTALNQSETPRSIRISDSDWTFFPQETLVFGWILRFLTEHNL